MLSHNLGASLLRNLLSGEGVIQAGNGIFRAGNEIKKIIMLPYPLTNLQIQRYFQKKTKFKGVYSRNDLTSLDKYKSIGMDWMYSFV